MKQKKVLKLQLKSVTEEGGIGKFEGYASVFGNKDSQGDVVVKGAFKRTIKNTFKWPILWQHKSDKLIGWNTAAEEDDHGLKVNGDLVLDCPEAKSAFALLKHALEVGATMGMSIGFQIVDKAVEKGVTYLNEIKMWEYSIVTFAANEEAAVTGTKSVSAFIDLPIGDAKKGWNVNEAQKRVKQWAGEDWDKYKQAFLFSEVELEDNIKGYKCQIADIVDGKLTAMPRAIYYAAKSIEFADVSASDKFSAKRHLERYYAKMDKQSPFAADTKFTSGPAYFKATDFATALQTELDMRALQEMRWTLSSALYDSLNSIECDDSLTLTEKVANVDTVFQQYGKAMTSWYSKYFAALPPDEDDDADDKAAMPVSVRSSLTKAMRMHDKAHAMHVDANKMHAKGSSLIAATLAQNEYSEASHGDPTHKPVTPPARHSDSEKCSPVVLSAFDTVLAKMKVGIN